MNAFQMLSSHQWVERLGWTLVHFLWQGLAIAVAYEAVRRAMPRSSSSQARYLLACAALAAMMAAPLVTWEVQRPAASPTITRGAESTSLPIPSPVSGVIGAAPASTVEAVSTAEPRQFLLWVVMAWLTGAAVFWVRLAGGWMATARMRSVLVRHSPPEWQDTLKVLGARVGVFRPVRLLVSALVQVPTVVGWLRPVVLVPVGALGGLPASYLEALLLHELAHIRRHDYLVNILQSAAEALLFYHPAMWWISGHIRVERELCCDHLVVAASGDALTYARALAELESYRPAHLTVALAAGGGRLTDRIAKLLGEPQPPVRARLGPGAVAIAILLAGAGYAIFAQPNARAAFQSVSIRRSAPDSGEPFQRPTSMRANASLMLLIQFAYAPHENPMAGHTIPLPASQIIGGADWMNSERYDLEIKADPNTDPALWWQMWQTLLADRFKLKLHRETRDLPLYVLTLANNGVELPAAKPADCIAFPPGTSPRHTAGKVDCGYISGPAVGFSTGPLGHVAGLEIVGRKVRTTDLARELASILDRPILDRTGFTGEFDLKLKFTRDGALTGLPPGYGAPTDPSLPNLFDALEQQLGFRLTAARGPVEVLVIDHAERPIEN